MVQTMIRDPLYVAANAALAVWTLATVIVGLLYHFGANGDQYQPWVFPMSMGTAGGAILLDRLKKSRRQH